MVAGCSFDPAESLGRDLDIRVVQAFVEQAPCYDNSTYDVCHYLDATVESRTGENFSLTADRWAATENRHYADQNGGWTPAATVQGPKSVGGGDPVDLRLGFDTEKEVRLGILRFAPETGSSMTMFVPEYKTNGPTGNATEDGFGVTGPASP